MSGAQAINEIPAAVVGDDGYWYGDLMGASDLGALRGEVERLFLERIRTVAPEHIGAFERLGIGRYHEACHLIEHSEIWGRLARRFDRKALDVFYGTGMFDALRRTFGAFSITDEENLELPLVRWRLVRPNSAGDVGPAHADAWFWEINRWPVEPGRKLVKVWSMLYGGAGASGLTVLPGSHRHHFDFSGEIRDGSPKPVFDPAGLEMTTVPTAPGQSVVFHYNLLHGGAVTAGDCSRVSFEFTMAVDEERLPA